MTDIERQMLEVADLRRQLAEARADVARLTDERKLFASKMRRLWGEITGRVSMDARRQPNSHRRQRRAAL